MASVSQGNLKHHVPTFLADAFMFIVVLSLFPAILLLSTGQLLNTAILISVVLPFFLIAWSYRDTIEIDLGQAQIFVTMTILWFFFPHRKVYSFQDVQYLKYSTDSDLGKGRVELSLADGKRFVIQTNSDAKPYFDFLLAHFPRRYRSRW
jgi:hypothetical protein